MPSSRRIIAEREAGLRWYVARTSPRAEYAVAEKLRRDGYETFVPCIQTEGPRSGRLGGPLFPGYLFLRYDLAAWGPEALDRVGRLLGLVTFGGMAPPVPDEDMEELRRRVDALNQWHGCCPARPGEQVHLRKPAYGLAGTVTDGPSAQDRIPLLLRFLGQLVSAEAEDRDAHPATAEASKRVGRGPRRTRGKGRYIKGFGPRAGESHKSDSG